MKKLKFIMLFFVLAIFAVIVINRVKYFIPNTPEYTIRMYFNSYVSGDINIYDNVCFRSNEAPDSFYDESNNIQFQFLVSSKRYKDSDASMHNILRTLNNWDNLDLYSEGDILVYKIEHICIRKDESKTLGSGTIKTVWLVKNKKQDGKPKWLWYDSSQF